MKGKLKLSYVLTLCLAFTLAVAVPFLASAETIEAWVARYNGPRNSLDISTAIALDALGNIYVTGQSDGSGSGRDYATVKYDTNGNQLWLARYNGLGNDDDWAGAIAVDASGNVYVTGGSEGTGTADDYATVKYNTDGSQFWVVRYNGPGNDGDAAQAIAVDGAGNVYVTGRSEGSGTGSDYSTIKYDTDGNQLWVAQYNGIGNDDDWAGAIAVDGAGNVYVTGSSEGSEANRDYATVKYDTDGNQLWVAQYNGPGNGDDYAHAIAIDPSGNVYVTGQSEGSGTGFDYATIKYDADGNQLWVVRYNGPENNLDSASAIAIDPSGNVYVTGASYGGKIDSDYATVKYDIDGNELWVARYNEPGNKVSAEAITVDAAGNVYVTGGGCAGRITVKYDTHGDELWMKRYNGPVGGLDYASDLAVDASGNVYVTGGNEGSGTDLDYATVKYVEDVKMQLPEGWSMISLPVGPAVSSVRTVFPEAVKVYKYQKGTGYVLVPEGETLEVGIGYWILLDNPQSYVLRGTEIIEYTMPVADGWYMIGGCSMLADTMITSGKIDVIYGYTQGIGYTRVPGSQLLERGKGYWILFSNTSEGAKFTASTSASQ